MEVPLANRVAQDPDRIDVRIGSVLRDMRKARLVTLEVLGQQTGIAYQTIHRYEKGRRVPVGTLYRIAKVLQFDLGAIFDGIDGQSVQHDASPAREDLEAAQALARIGDPVVKELLRSIIDLLDAGPKDG